MTKTKDHGMEPHKQHAGHTVLFTPKEWEARNIALYGKLVSMSGSSETLEGEMLRAINKITYRYYNDGDYWYQGYGTETAGSAAAFLSSAHIPNDLNLLVLVNDSDQATGNSYEIALFAILKAIVEYVEAKKEYTPNPDLDMLKFDAKYEDELPMNDEYDEE